MDRATLSLQPRHARLRRALSALAALLLALAPAALAPAPAGAQEVMQAPLADRPEPPPFYAIEGARIVTGTGDVIESGTVVIADGLIAAVGTGVAVPPEAWVIDGSGLTVYPGLFDGLTELGLAGGRDEAEEEGGGASLSDLLGSGDIATGPDDRPATHPWRSAADMLNPEDGQIETWREGGYTTALVAPEGGLVAGQGAVISLGGEAREMVVAAPAALRLSLRPEGGFLSFPGSLFGVMSYLEQLFADARRYDQAQDVYQDDPRGARRPRYDRTLDPIHRAVEEGWAILIPGDDAVEIRRAIDLGRNLGGRTVVVGGHGAWRAAPELAEAGVPVLVNLDWPERGSDPDPEGDETLPSLMVRANAPASPAVLEDAGATWAFYSGGAASPKAALDGVRKAIAAGLSEEAALRGLTAGPAAIFGVSDRIGTVEAGKIANLLVTDGDLFADDTKVAMTFVDGRKREVRESERPEEPPAADFGGTWELTVETPQGAQEVEADLEMAEDGSLSGTLTGSQGEQTVSGGWVSGDRFQFESSLEMGGRSMDVSYTGTFEGDALDGTATVGGRFSTDFTGERTSPPQDRTADAAPETETAPGASRATGPDLEALEAWMPVDWSAPAEPILIEGATLLTVTGGTVEGDLLLRDGKIATVGGDLSAPAGALTLDGTGLYVTPGLIDAHSHIAAEAINEGSVNVSSMVGIEQVIDPSDIDIYREAAGGVTTSHVMHGSANPIGGKNAIIKHRWGADADGLLFEGAPPTIKFALGENVKRSNFPVPEDVPQRYPGTRMGQIDVIRQAFIDAKEYQAEWQAYRAGGSRGVPPKRSLTLEPLVEILEGERFVHAHSYRADEILQLMRVAEEIGFRIAVFQHVLEGYKVADEIAEHGAGASTFSDWWAYKLEAYDAIPYNAAIMTERGVNVSINSDSAEEARHLNQEAAKTMKWGGMSEEQALAMVTINPAQQLRVEDRVGSLEVGKDADVVVWRGHPLSTTAKAVTTIVDGRVVFDEERDRERQEAIAAAKERLRERMGEGGEQDDEGEEEGR